MNLQHLSLDPINFALRVKRQLTTLVIRKVLYIPGPLNDYCQAMHLYITILVLPLYLSVSNNCKYVVLPMDLCICCHICSAFIVVRVVHTIEDGLCCFCELVQTLI